MLAYPLNSALSNLWGIHDLLPTVITPALIKENWKRARTNIQAAHSRQAARYDRGRRQFRCKVGDTIYVRNYPGRGRQVSSSSKFSPRFIGPCQVVRKLGPVNLLVRELSTGREFRVHVTQVKITQAKARRDV